MIMSWEASKDHSGKPRGTRGSGPAQRPPPSHPPFHVCQGYKVSVSHPNAALHVMLRQPRKGGTANASICNEGFIGRAGKASSEVIPDVFQELKHLSTSMVTLPETMDGTHSAWEQTLRG